MVFTINIKNDFKVLFKLGIICGILHQEYLKMHEIKVNICGDIRRENFNSIETFYWIYKNSIFHLFLDEA